MTAICAIADGSSAWMGWDSFCGTSDEAEASKMPKVVRVGEYLIGCAGYWSVLQHVHHRFVPPEPKGPRLLQRFMATEFSDALASALSDAGADKASRRVAVAVSGRLFLMESDGAALEARHDYITLGSSAPIMDGSLFTTKGGEPRERIRSALKAAAYHTALVRPPFRILSA